MTVTKFIIMLILTTFVGLFGLSSFAQTGSAIEVPNPTPSCPQYCSCDNQGNVLYCAVPAVPLPNPISTCPQYCSCDNQGNVLYCAVPAVPLPTPQPVPSAPEPVPALKSYPEPLPATFEPAPSGEARPASLMAPAGSTWSTAVPVRVEAIPTESTLRVSHPVSVDAPTLVSCPAGCICEKESTVCPATAAQQIVVPIVPSVPVGAQAVPAIPVAIRITDDKKVSVTSQAVTAVTVEDVTVDQGALFVGKGEQAQPVNVLPHQAAETAVATVQAVKVSTVELAIEDEKPIYTVHGTRAAKLLFFIPVTVSVAVTVDGMTGEASDVAQPWWAFLAR